MHRPHWATNGRAACHLSDVELRKTFSLVFLVKRRLVVGVAFEARRKCIYIAVDGVVSDRSVSTAVSLPVSICVRWVEGLSEYECACACARVYVYSCLCLFAWINDVIQLKWNFSHLTAHMRTATSSDGPEQRG